MIIVILYMFLQAQMLCQMFSSAHLYLQEMEKVEVDLQQQQLLVLLPPPPLLQEVDQASSLALIQIWTQNWLWLFEFPWKRRGQGKKLLLKGPQRKLLQRL
uniref:Uncharacterized protein n=1 Tax=Picea sitchensis TaxID=3332 RepID=A9NKN0_PICSI|nr:unknown [Picea sitchensis]